LEIEIPKIFNHVRTVSDFVFITFNLSFIF